MKTVIGLARLAGASLFGLLCASVAACGGEDSSSPRAACEDLTVALCGQLYTCLSPAELALAGYTSEAACVTQLQEVAGCAAQTLDNACTGNETFQADQAARCNDQVAGLECTQLRDPDFALETGAPACGLVCAVE
jgi:hypothetical protein